eukprot:symbB.v1.2.027135.t1/scaffold2764.1/size72906/2
MASRLTNLSQAAVHPCNTSETEAPFDHQGWQPHNPEVIPGHGHELYTGHEASFSGPRCPPDPPVPAFAADLVGPTASQVPAAHFMPEAPCDASNGPTDTSTKGRRPGLTSMGSCNILCDEPPVTPLPFASAAPRPSMRKPLVNPPSLEVFRATHGLPPCDDESYDPYGPYGDLGDVETDEAPYPLDESRVPRSSQRDGWMWMGDADAASSPVQFSGLKLFHNKKVWSLGLKIVQWLADYFVKNVR